MQFSQIMIWITEFQFLGGAQMFPNATKSGTHTAHIQLIPGVYFLEVKWMKHETNH
jgi:hypothetical protein